MYPMKSNSEKSKGNISGTDTSMANAVSGIKNEK